MNNSCDNRNEPVVSLITVVRNGAGTLEAAFTSIAAHSAPGVEHIVIDGASTDDTPLIIKRHESQITSWISEPDRGIYDAMNKGVGKARGKWILFLGCDDELCAHLADILPLLKEDRTVYYGSSYWRHARRTYDGPFTASKLALTNICHQSIFYPRQALQKYPFDLRYRLQADWVVNMQCFSDPDFRFQHIPFTVTTYNDASGASSIQTDSALERDYLSLLWRHFPWPIALWRTCITLGGRTLRKLGWQGRPAYTKR